ncbi:glycosyltransferase family 2 protein [Catalinimonas niigatensis]|uniref:glycosyltransferase family 2 protein n=1 Tax=Catalinimonas niigatensis TaxID=1397264 RepID=UPI002664ED0B|nr:glycosyltransferase [Catalinimonas niigatensis]WPP53503.1 glycosyltransferase [Catalinimonas niigatensis]
MSQPLVTIICLCYNHEKFIVESLTSVWKQAYEHIEVIIVDDCSTDDSVAIIQSYLATYPSPFPLKTLFLKQNLGNCAAFNRGWKMAKGEYIIDLATDDILLPKRVSSQVAHFQQLPEDYGVVFTESKYIDATGRDLGYHYDKQYKHIRPIPTGDIYQEVLSRYFISSPTMMIRKEVLQYLGGYDEQLAYEDFDFWVRSSRKYKYTYLDECTTLVRKLESSLSKGIYKKGDRQLHSTFLVCQKAKSLNKTLAEQEALIKRVKSEIRQSVFSDSREETVLFFGLLEEIESIKGFYRILYLLFKTNIPLNWLRSLYIRVRY